MPPRQNVEHLNRKIVFGDHERELGTAEDHGVDAIRFDVPRADVVIALPDLRCHLADRQVVVDRLFEKLAV